MAKTLNAKDLNLGERDAFIRQYMELWEEKYEFVEDNKASRNAISYRMPWHVGQDIMLTGNSPEGMASNFFQERLKNR